MSSKEMPKDTTVVHVDFTPKEAVANGEDQDATVLQFDEYFVGQDAESLAELASQADYGSAQVIHPGLGKHE